jgi:hypothetical protein
VNDAVVSVVAVVVVATAGLDESSACVPPEASTSIATSAPGLDGAVYPTVTAPGVPVAAVWPVSAR